MQARKKDTTGVTQLSIVQPNSLTERAMLVSLNISKWTARKHDKEVSDDVATQHGLQDKNLGTYRKQLIPKKHLEALNKIASDARQDHYELTAPWKDNGERILTNVHFVKYTERMRKYQEAWEREVSAFLSMYSVYKEEARQSLGTLFKEFDYPSVREITNKFEFTVDVSPLSDSTDFRVRDMVDAEANRIKDNYEELFKRRTERAMKDAWERIREVVQKMSERLHAYKVLEDGKVDHPFRDTLVSNITDVLSILPGINLTNDPELDKFSARIKEELTRIPADMLRTDETARKNTAEAADKILAAISDFI